MAGEYSTYRAVNNPSEVDIANKGDFDHIVARVRNSGTKRKDKLLKLQICFGIVLQPSTIVRPPWKDAPVVKAPIIAIPKRVYNEETSPATTAKKPRTATTRLLEDEEKKREAEKGTLQEVITSIQLSIEFADRRNDQLKTKGKKKRRKTYHDNSSSPERPPLAQYAFQPPFWLSNAFPFQYQSMQQAPSLNYLQFNDQRESKSSPLRSGGKSTEELLFALKTFLCNTSTSATPSYNYAFRILIEEEYDIDMIKEITITEAKELNIKVGVLKTIKRQLSLFKKWYNQQNHMEEEPGEELDEDEEGEDEEK
ncbi:hypothetical protein BKA64DRAFT_643863 [Cadophora sp. MPI-SDFR-AT-0126]|nr:hypothetical protein BKA64DRAFT_643863 [Leotiomycetes sp. MPI-SDFR-AT-0126]